MTDTHSPFLAIIMATNNASRTQQFLENIVETCEDVRHMEVWIKIDREDQATFDRLSDITSRLPLKCYLVQMPKEKGYFSLHHGYNAMLAQVSKSVYFCTILTDEVRFETPGWDSVLKNYIGMYEDDIFRIKISDHKNKNYAFFADCYYKPDNYPIITKKWLQLVGGWGYFWGPDSWQQCIDYYLGKCPTGKIPWGVFRSIPDYDIKLSGGEAGQNISGPTFIKRWRMSENARILIFSWSAKESFNKMAKRLHMAILAKEQGHKRVVMKDIREEKQFIVYDAEGTNELFRFDYGLEDEPLHFGVQGVHTRIKIYSSMCRLFGDHIAWWATKLTKPFWKQLNLWFYYLARLINKLEEKVVNPMKDKVSLGKHPRNDYYVVDFDNLEIIPFVNEFTSNFEALK